MIKLNSIIVASVLMLGACKSSNQNANEAMTDSTAVDSSAMVVEEVAYVMPPASEMYVAGIHMNKKHHEKKKAGLSTADVDTESTFETVPVDIFILALADSGIVVQTPDSTVAKPDSIVTTTTATELNDDQTVIELGKRGQASSMEVISDPKDPNKISEIVYTDKKHKDVYNVQAGMSARDVRKLRHEMKHMVRKGQVYLYSDDSNIMYKMTTTDVTKKTSYTDSEVDDMTVDAVVWKNNADTKKEKKAKKWL